MFIRTLTKTSLDKFGLFFVLSFIRKSASMSGSKSAVILLAEGAEEIEFITAVDVLRRAKVVVKIAGVPDGSPKTCSRGVVITPDESLCDVSGEIYDAVIIPGGMPGVTNLMKSEDVKVLLKKQEDRQGLIAAICAGPLVLKEHSIGLKKKITSYPSVKKDLTSDFNYIETDSSVVVDGELITSRGPGTAMDFALSITEHLMGKQTRDEIAKGLIYAN